MATIKVEIFSSSHVWVKKKNENTKNNSNNNHNNKNSIKANHTHFRFNGSLSYIRECTLSKMKLKWYTLWKEKEEKRWIKGERQRASMSAINCVTQTFRFIAVNFLLFLTSMLFVFFYSFLCFHPYKFKIYVNIWGNKIFRSNFAWAQFIS